MFGLNRQKGMPARLLICLGLVFAGLVHVGRADVVVYETTGQFNGGSNSITFGAGANALTITFTGVAPNTVEDSPFTFVSLGTFNTSTIGSGASITSGTTFSLDISQFAPTSGIATMLGTLSGTVSQDQSTGSVTFSISSVTIGSEQYSLLNNPVVLLAPGMNNGNVTVDAQISVVPEPTVSYLLLGTTLAAGATTLVRRKQSS